MTRGSWRVLERDTWMIDRLMSPVSLRLLCLCVVFDEMLQRDFIV